MRKHGSRNSKNCRNCTKRAPRDGDGDWNRKWHWRRLDGALTGPPVRALLDYEMLDASKWFVPILTSADATPRRQFTIDTAKPS
jgi:hypothetical protein